MSTAEPRGKTARTAEPGTSTAASVALRPEIVGRTRVTVAEARATPPPAGHRSVPLLAHGSMLVKFYAPVGVDPQTPHARDELYVVAEGRGTFVNGEERQPCALGDVLFVPAGRVHRFEDFSPGFAVWVFFYGPEGGEATDQHE
jgi:mannose-6-phosphate isomerase-like protein (cupin superfamily)